MLNETYMELLKDPAHWAFELTLEVVTIAAAAAWGWVRVKRHIHKDVDDMFRATTSHFHEDLEQLNGRNATDELHQG